jgi:hypothetical protein
MNTAAEMKEKTLAPSRAACVKFVRETQFADRPQVRDQLGTHSQG